jgi:hypothetical protein
MQPTGFALGGAMDADERERFDYLLEAMTYEFTRAMESHGIPGEAEYYWTETMVFWGTLGMYDAEHSYLLN